MTNQSRSIWARSSNHILGEFIARRAYCVGTPLIFLFVRRLSVCPSVRPSVTLSSGPGFCETCMPGTQSAFKTGSVCDVLQNMRAAKTIRVSLSIPVSLEIPHMDILQTISRIPVLWRWLAKFEWFLHNRSFGSPLPCASAGVIYLIQMV